MVACKAVKVEIISTEGSSPRDKGAILWVFDGGIDGSIGGGNLENEAIQIARNMLPDGAKMQKRFILGPASGQCCGGVVELSFEIAEYEKLNPRTLAIFGAGHVGVVLTRLARAIGIDVFLYDDRFKIELPNPEIYQPIAIPEMAIASLPNQAFVVIMTHDHALDFMLAHAALAEDRFTFVGMIGSKSKAARFHNQHGALSEKLISPIAKFGNDKRPEAIALNILSEIIKY